MDHTTRELARKLRIEIDSLPTEIDVVERRIRQLEIERVALDKEEDAASVERLAALDKDAGDALPFVRLRDLFDMPGEAPGRENVVVVQYAGERAGLVGR